MKKIVVKILGIIIAVIMLLQSTVSIAASESQLKNQKDENEQKIQDAKDKKDEITEQKNKTVKEVEDISSKIKDYESQIAELDGQIGNLNSQIADAENTLNKAQEDFDKQEKLMEARLIAVQEQGDTSLLDVLLSSENIVDLISRYYFVTELASADTELLGSIKKQKEEIQQAKDKLEASKKELNTAKASKQGVSVQLKAAKSAKDQQVARLTEDEQKIQQQIDELAEANKAIDKKIEQERAEAQRRLEEQRRQQQQNQNKPSGGGSSASNVKPNASGFISPLPAAYSKVTTGMTYSSGQYHGAIDFGSGGINGQPIYAVADGIVMISENLGNRSYGNYILIMHSNGLYTLYAHGQNGSRLVNKGDYVKQGQQIMSVGTTGNSTGPHLHFEVRTGSGGWNNRVDPKPYLEGHIR